jgi:GAF domain-containing protein
MAATLDDEMADLRRANAELQQRLDERTAERDEGEAQKAATTEVLQVINSSPGNLAPVFAAMLEKAALLCGAAFGLMSTYDGEQYHTVATHGVGPELAEFMRAPPHPDPESGLSRIERGEDLVIFSDIADTDVYRNGDARRRALVDIGGAHSYAMVALRKDRKLLGIIAAYRREVRPFTDKQIALLQSFAAQAVIAMENARLLGELHQRTGDLQESLEYQTATSDVLKVISRSTFDLQPVFETIVETAARLCDADNAMITNREGEDYRVVATFAISPEYDAFLRGRLLAVSRGSMAGRAAMDGQVVQIDDIASDPEYSLAESVTLQKTRTALGVPLLRDGGVVGTITLARSRVQPFTDRQIELVRTFADQAVIALENARLITETREALEQQTATAEVLGVINSSPGDLAPVFDAMLERAFQLCEAQTGHLMRYENGEFNRAASFGGLEDFDKIMPRHQPLVGIVTRDSVPFRTLVTRTSVHVLDMAEDASYRAGAPAEVAGVQAGIRTALFVPLLREGEVIGNFVMHRREKRPFTDKQIALVENFAAQAVIAIENTRLITETREALDQQTATSEVLQVINSSPGDLAPVFDAILEKAHTLCAAAYGGLLIREGEQFCVVAVHGDKEFAEYWRQLGPLRPPADVPTPLGRLVRGERVVHVVDALEDEFFSRDAPPELRRLCEIGNVRTLLLVPLRKDDALLGVITAFRQEVRPFSEKQIALLENFAAQAVIAMENARLITETREALDQQTATTEVLQVHQFVAR